ncbi:MAG TPA: protein kinase, partial [Candidatus Nitrosotenuis sp.]|nr:protein kinase [Candidatus Nitrosotenuis sp.]
MLPLAARPDLDGGEELAPGVVACGGRVFKEIVPGDPALLRQVVESLSRLRHPGLARVEGWVEAEGRFWVVMERVPGRTLEEEIRARAPLSAGQAAGWTADLCGALDYLVEQGRPEMLLALSPDHVMVTPEGHLKLINYGLSRPGQPVPPGAGQAALGRILARLAGGSAQEGASGLPADLAWI